MKKSLSADAHRSAMSRSETDLRADYPFSQCRASCGFQYADKDAYLAGEKELLDLLKTSDGNDTVIIYLGRERAKKVLPRNWNVRAGEALVTTLSEMLGEKNVKVVEKPLGKISS